MVTDRPPLKKALLKQFLESDQLVNLELPRDDRLSALAKSIEAAMKVGTTKAVRGVCDDLATAVSEFYAVGRPQIRVLAARPLRVREGRSIELFGDYTDQTMLIRLWMWTAVRKQVTSFGTFLSTLCHEFSHHLDCEHFGFRATPHTRGFYGRTSALYHHVRQTPVKQLFWVKISGDRWRIDWNRTNHGS